MGRDAGAPGRLETLLARHWWQARPTLLAQALRPLSGLYRALAWLARARAGPPQRAPVPVVVVGNLVLGGTGKTPVVIALVAALAAAGRRPGVISRGHARAQQGTRCVPAEGDAAEFGDEPVLIRRRTGVPVAVGRRRLDAARLLCAEHPELDVIVADDGLQHHALAHDAALVVFDDRGAGNGLLLPAGPLREPLPAQALAHWHILYSGTTVSTALAGSLTRRGISRALPLAAWLQGHQAEAVALRELRGRTLLALAGIGVPEKFFKALELAGLRIQRLPQRDHARYDRMPAPPWPEGTPEVVTTEKDAVKLAAAADSPTRVWVVPLDCELPADLLREVLAALPRPE